MSKTLKKLPYFSIKADDLAKWLDTQKETWWVVDGDPVLTSRVDFPCPHEELSGELRKINESLRLFDPRNESKADGNPVSIDQLDQIADRENKAKGRTYLLCWEGSDNQWLLEEDPNADED